MESKQVESVRESTSSRATKLNQHNVVRIDSATPARHVRPPHRPPAIASSPSPPAIIDPIFGAIAIRKSISAFVLAFTRPPPLTVIDRDSDALAPGHFELDTCAQ